MSPGKPPGKRGKPPKKLEPKKIRAGLLEEADQELWDFVATSIGPARGKPRVLDVDIPKYRLPDGPQIEPQVPQRDAPQRARPSLPAAASPPASAAKSAAPKPKQSPPEPQAVTLERRRARRIARGADEIEARLDLHGMTQDAAWGALAGFIRSCHAGGLRTVLVITGKGGPRTRREDDGNSYDDWDGWQEKPRGVLRRNVPMWLGQPDLAAMVVSYSTAHIRHGGEGALYVQLRTKR